MALSEIYLDHATMHTDCSQLFYCHWRARYKDVHLYYKMDVALQKLDSIRDDLLDILDGAQGTTWGIARRPSK